MLPQDTKVFKTKILFAMASFIYSPVAQEHISYYHSDAQKAEVCIIFQIQFRIFSTTSTSYTLISASFTKLNFMQ